MHEASTLVLVLDVSHRSLSRHGRIGGCLLLVLGLLRATGAASEAASDNSLDPEFRVGSWVWAEESFEKQTVRFWRGFAIPGSAAVTNARLRITVDNSYQIYLDGRELGRGSDWRWLTEYDVTRLLEPGRHVLAVEAFNDRELGGMLMGLRVELRDGRLIEIASDESWRVVPGRETGWETRLDAGRDWPRATLVGMFGAAPHAGMMQVLQVMALPAFEPITRRFWQTGWFQILLISLCVATLLMSLWLMGRLTIQSKAHQVLERERARIARDIHDDVGAGLTQLILQGEVAQTDLPEGSTASEQFAQLSEQARSVAQRLDEVVWAVNSRRDTVRDFISYICKYAQDYFHSSPVRCRLDVEPDIPALSLGLVVRRNLFLAAKEAFNNVAKHSEASRVYLRIHRQGPSLLVVVEDNGKGFDPGTASGERDGLRNMNERMEEAGGTCRILGRPGEGCLVEFKVPLRSGPLPRLRWLKLRAGRKEDNLTTPSTAAGAPSPQRKHQ